MSLKAVQSRLYYVKFTNIYSVDINEHQSQFLHLYLR